MLKAKFDLLVGEVDANKTRNPFQFEVEWGEMWLEASWWEECEVNKEILIIHDCFLDLACEGKTTWLLDAIGIHWLYYIDLYWTYIGYIGCYFNDHQPCCIETDYSLLGLMLWASLFLIIFLIQNNCVPTTCDPCTVWREILVWPSWVLRSDFVWLNGCLGGLDRRVMG